MVEQKNYIKEVEEYGRKQYIPGAYTGSEMPPHVKYHKNKLLKFVAFVGVTGIAIAIIYNLIELIS